MVALGSFKYIQFLFQLMLQGYLLASSVDYMTEERVGQSYIWLLLLIGWLTPTTVMLASHAIILRTNRFTIITNVYLRCKSQICKF